MLMEITISQNNITPNITVTEQDNQLIFIDGGGVAIGISDVLVNGSSVVSNNIAYVIVPTKTSELVNNSGFITNEIDPTVPYYVKQITLADINNWNSKQNALVSGANIKTINNNSLLGSGNIEITGNVYTAGDGINIDSNNIITNEITSYNDLEDLPEIPTKTSDLINDNDFVSEDELSDVAFSGSYVDLSNTPDIPTDISELDNDVGYITKEVNNLDYYTLSSNLSSVATSGDYDDLTNKPTIPTVNDGTLTIQVNGTTVNTFSANSSSNITTNITVPTHTSDLTNDNNYITKSEVDNYSTSESQIGTWIDGKPLYRKVIYFSALGNNATVNQAHNISNMKICTKISGVGINASGTTYYNIGTPTTYNVPGDGITCWVNTTNVYINSAKDLSLWSAYIILEYTKTTD